MLLDSLSSSSSSSSSADGGGLPLSPLSDRFQQVLSRLTSSQPMGTATTTANASGGHLDSLSDSASRSSAAPHRRGSIAVASRIRSRSRSIGSMISSRRGSVAAVPVPRASAGVSFAQALIVEEPSSPPEVQTSAPATLCLPPPPLPPSHLSARLPAYAALLANPAARQWLQQQQQQAVAVPPLMLPPRPAISTPAPPTAPSVGGRRGSFRQWLDERRRTEGNTVAPTAASAAASAIVGDGDTGGSGNAAAASTVTSSSIAALSRGPGQLSAGKSVETRGSSDADDIAANLVSETDGDSLASQRLLLASSFLSPGKEREQRGEDRDASAGDGPAVAPVSNARGGAAVEEAMPPAVHEVAAALSFDDSVLHMAPALALDASTAGALPSPPPHLADAPAALHPSEGDSQLSAADGEGSPVPHVQTATLDITTGTVEGEGDTLAAVAASAPPANSGGVDGSTTHSPSFSTDSLAVAVAAPENVAPPASPPAMIASAASSLLSPLELLAGASDSGLYDDHDDDQEGGNDVSARRRSSDVMDGAQERQQEFAVAVAGGDQDTTAASSMLGDESTLSVARTADDTFASAAAAAESSGRATLSQHHRSPEDETIELPPQPPLVLMASEGTGAVTGPVRARASAALPLLPSPSKHAVTSATASGGGPYFMRRLSYSRSAVASPPLSERSAAESADAAPETRKPSDVTASQRQHPQAQPVGARTSSVRRHTISSSIRRMSGAGAGKAATREDCKAQCVSVASNAAPNASSFRRASLSSRHPASSSSSTSKSDRPLPAWCHRPRSASAAASSSPSLMTTPPSRPLPLSARAATGFSATLGRGSGSSPSLEQLASTPLQQLLLAEEVEQATSNNHNTEEIVALPHCSSEVDRVKAYVDRVLAETDAEEAPNKGREQQQGMIVLPVAAEASSRAPISRASHTSGRTGPFRATRLVLHPEPEGRR